MPPSVSLYSAGAAARANTCPLPGFLGSRRIRGVASEAITKSVLQYFLVWSTDVLRTALEAGFVPEGKNGNNRKRSAKIPAGPATPGWRGLRVP